jgi:3-deoxy-D-manno-octulosonic-acid transferase
MQTFSLIIYNISLRVYYLGIWFASFLNNKAKLWIEGRKTGISGLNTSFSKTGKRYWFHCASLGEFEQARPVIEALKKSRPDSIIVLTFFSPSGYEVRKNYKQADLVAYLPLDTASNALQFLDAVKPDLTLFVKYEFWHYFLAQLKAQNIPSILFSSVFQKNQIFFKWYGVFFKNMLGMFSKIFVQNQESKALLLSIGINSEIAFDTRFDRVFEIAQTRQAFPLIEKFKGDAKILIAGSTWPKDEELILALIKSELLPGYKYIIAPHQVDANRLKELAAKVPVAPTFLTDLDDANALQQRVIIVNSIGDLASLYAYGDIAYVGGGFNAGVHNILEAAVYGMPVIFGPNYKKSVEAEELIHQLAAFSITNFENFSSTIKKLIENRTALAEASKTATKYVTGRTGGTTKILSFLATNYSV